MPTDAIGKLRWCVWHNNVEKARARLKQVLMMCRIAIAQAPKFREALKHLDCRIREFFKYLIVNSGTTIIYAQQHRAALPISTAMAESVVNQVINARMCKRQSMRWTPRGAHLLAQVRCAVLNNNLAPSLATHSEARRIANQIGFWRQALLGLSEFL